jgi:hypothetical protein
MFKAMEANPSLVTVSSSPILINKLTEGRDAQTFNELLGKRSIMIQPCTGDCIAAMICYIRSGSASLAMQNCKPGFG